MHYFSTCFQDHSKNRSCPTPPHRVLLFTYLAVIATIAPARGETPFSVWYSLLNPPTNAQVWGHGAHVAIDTNFAVASAVSVYGGTAQAVSVYDTTNGVLRYTLLNPGQGSSFGSCVAVSGTRVIVGNRDYHPLFTRACVYVYDLASVKPTTPVLRSYPGGSALLSVAASGKYVAARTQLGVSVYDLTSAAPSNSVVSMATSPNGDALAISGTRLVVGTPAGVFPQGKTNASSVSIYDLASSTPNAPVLTLQSPTPTADNSFGISVAISGDRLVVGTDRGGTNSGSAYVYDLASATPSVPVATLNNPTSSSADYFGHSVGISGTRVVVGAFGVGTTGRAYIYDLAGATPGTPVATLNNPTPAGQDQFAKSVAIAGSRVIVGAPGDDTVTTDGGSAYLYDVAGAQPAVPVATLNSGPVPASSSDPYSFGQGVAISGTRMIAGYSGRAYVYDLAGTMPVVPTATLYNPVAGFGHSVAISDYCSVVGAYQVNTVYVYDITRSRPEVPTFVLDNPEATPASFGFSVGISGTRVAVGAPDAGRAYVYDLASSTPTQPAFTLNNPGTAPGFGRAVAISGTRLVIGAFSQNYTNSAAYVYDLTSTPPGVFRLIDPTPSPEMFGSSVAISGTRVAVGAYMAGWGFYIPGRAHIFDLASDTPAVAVATLRNPNPSTYQGLLKYPGFGYSVAVSGTRVVVSSIWSEGESATGKAYVYDIAGNTPTVPIATLGNPSFAEYDSFGWSVAADGMTVVVASAQPPVGGAAFVFGPTPQLTIAAAGTNSAKVSWAPTNSPEFFLQSADKLAPTNWVYAPSGTPNPLTIPATNRAGFYRLFSP